MMTLNCDLGPWGLDDAALALYLGASDAPRLSHGNEIQLNE